MKCDTVADFHDVEAALNAIIASIAQYTHLNDLEPFPATR